MIFDKEKLLSVFDQTKDSEPMPSQESGFRDWRQLEKPPDCVRRDCARREDS